MTNEEYSQLAAKAAGVAIGSNGKPAFTSYEQSMKYAEALTNLHKSGINRNSTTQEIAAASVGATVGQNGRPNISSVSQGVGYGNALKNLKSNPQPNVNQNSSGAKSNATGSQNNTGNNANTNPTGSTKPSSSANTSRSANPTNSTSSSNKFTNEEYSQLAAQVTGVAIDPKGRPVFSSYEESMRYAEALTNLHKSGINKNSTPFEIAAASVGAKNNTPNIFNPSQLMGYSKALVNLLKGTQQGVSYVEPDSNGAKVSSNHEEKHLSLLSNYDYVKAAEELCKFSVKAISNNNMVDYFNAALRYLKENTDKINDVDNLVFFNVGATNVGGKKYAQHYGALSNEDFELIFDVCKDLNLDPYLILATGLHESSFTAVDSNGDPYTEYSSAFGIMQLEPATYSYYSIGGDYYNKYSYLYNKYNINISDKSNSQTQLIIGMCAYAEFSSYSWGSDTAQVVNHVGEGSTLDENKYIVNGKTVYKDATDWKLAPSTIEILYYRDEIAKSFGENSLYNNIYN